MPMIPQRVHVPSVRAAETGKEFNPETEAHHFGFTVKAVDPGCTLEIQIEERDGRVTRITTTDEPTQDVESIRRAVSNVLERFLHDWGIS